MDNSLPWALPEAAAKQAISSPRRRALRVLAGSALALSVLAGSAGQAFAKERATVSAQAVAAVVTRLSFIKTSDLDFGKIIPAKTAGTVTVTPAGVRTKTGTITLVGTGAKPATFAGYGFLNQLVLISVVTPVGTMRRVGGTETMTFDTFVIGSTPQAQLTTLPVAFRIVSSSGQFSFPVGATLRVNANQAPGNYTGNFTVLLVYQ